MHSSKRLAALAAALLLSAGAVAAARVSASGPVAVLAAAAPSDQPAAAPEIDGMPLDVVARASVAAQAAPPPFACRPCRVGLQVGHWRSGDLPAELAELRKQTGGDFGPYREIDVNLPVAKAAAELLRQAGVTVDLLPATVPHGYQANAFLAVHADRDMQQRWRGFKVTASALSANKAGSKLLADDLGREYAAATNLPLDLHQGAITPAMRFYYAFNTRRFQHAVAGTAPAAIIETGFVSDGADREALFEHPEVVAEAVAKGIERFLAELAS